jgi:hypothetical protein
LCSFTVETLEPAAAGFDQAGVCIYTNQAYCNFYERVDDQLQGHHYADYTLPPLRDLHDDLLERPIGAWNGCPVSWEQEFLGMATPWKLSPGGSSGILLRIWKLPGAISPVAENCPLNTETLLNICHNLLNGCAGVLGNIDLLRADLGHLPDVTADTFGPLDEAVSELTAEVRSLQNRVRKSITA